MKSLYHQYVHYRSQHFKCSGLTSREIIKIIAEEWNKMDEDSKKDFKNLISLKNI